MANTASVQVAGATVTGNYDANGILNLTITFSSGYVFNAGTGLSRSELEEAAKNSGNPADFQEALSIWSNYGDITNAITQQLTAETVSISAAQDPGQPDPATESTDYEPLQEPPSTNDGDEFAGIDAQIEANENTLQEPPQLSNEEVDDYLRTAGQNDTIQDQKTIPEGNVQGPPYDDEGNLMPGWSLNEDNDPVWVGNNPDGSVFVEPATKASAEASRNAAQGLQAKSIAQSQATQQDETNFKQREDWRVRLSLSPGATYLYKAQDPGILKPLQATDGIIFPYTPAISVQYNASYDGTDLTHSNYKFYTYKNSSVDSVSITCDFTAQDTYEANYLLAVIHFFRSVTKMFYGQDQNPKGGTPPPLCYLTGLGAFQFDAHPLVITSFNYTLPTDVDYIRAGQVTTAPGVNLSPSAITNNVFNSVLNRLTSSKLFSGGGKAPVNWSTPAGTIEPTYVPTKLQISISAVPIVSRNDISNKFSLRDYATGSLLRGTKRSGGGIW